MVNLFMRDIAASPPTVDRAAAIMDSPGARADESVLTLSRGLGADLIVHGLFGNWMLEPMKLESWHSSEDKRRWKIVRTDSYRDVEGEIITADEVTGECSVHVGDETKTLSFGPGGIRIVGRCR